METYLKVWVQANAKNNTLKARGSKGFDVWVTEPASNNRANMKMRALLAEHLGLPLDSVRIWSGHHSPSKMLVIDDKK